MHFNFQVKQWCRRRCDKFNVSIFAILPLHYTYALYQTLTQRWICVSNPNWRLAARTKLLFCCCSPTRTPTHTQRKVIRDVNLTARELRKSQIAARDQRWTQKNNSSHNATTATKVKGYRRRRLLIISKGTKDVARDVVAIDGQWMRMICVYYLLHPKHNTFVYSTYTTTQSQCSFFLYLPVRLERAREPEEEYICFSRANGDNTHAHTHTHTFICEYCESAESTVVVLLLPCLLLWYRRCLMTSQGWCLRAGWGNVEFSVDTRVHWAE